MGRAPVRSFKIVVLQQRDSPHPPKQLAEMVYELRCSFRHAARATTVYVQMYLNVPEGCSSLWLSCPTAVHMALRASTRTLCASRKGAREQGISNLTAYPAQARSFAQDVHSLQLAIAS